MSTSSFIALMAIVVVSPHVDKKTAIALGRVLLVVAILRLVIEVFA